MKGPIRIDTARLTLLRPEGGDAPEIFERYASDPEVTRFLAWPRHRSLEDTRAFLDFSTSEWERWPAGPYLIRSQAGGRLLGSTGLAFEPAGVASTGYVLARDAWGQGYATEALTAIVGVARQTGVARLFALCHPEHHASRRVLEKCGFQRDTDFAGEVHFPNLGGGATTRALRYGCLSARTGGTNWKIGDG